MVKTLKNKPNTPSVSSQWPYSQLQDETANQDGTPVNKEVYEDLHQFFMKMLDEAGISANELFDNATNGFQLFEAFKKHIAPTKAADKTIVNDSNNLNSVDIDDAHTTAFTANNPNALEFQQINVNASLEDFQIVVVTFEPGTTIKESGGNLNFKDGALGSFEARAGYPYKFRHIGGQFYLESAFHELVRGGALDVAPTSGSQTNSSALTLNSGWQENRPLEIWKDGEGYVHLRGTLEVSSSSPTTVPVFTVSSSYAPQTTLGEAKVHPAGGGDYFFQFLLDTQGDVIFIHKNGFSVGDEYELGEIIYNPNL